MATAVVDAVQLAPVSLAQVTQVLPQAQALGVETLAQTFAQMLQESAATVTTMTPLSQSASNATLVTPKSFAEFFAELFAATPAPTVLRFRHDSALLDSAARSALREMADRYKADGGHIRVVGHASSRTGDMDLAQHNRVNFDVSVDRAHAVANELMHLGVAPSALTVEAVGDAEAAFVEAMPSGEAANRRVEIYFTGA
jgi:outer membrane protein OmpA-like peptidoglycan-associated protein